MVSPLIVTAENPGRRIQRERWPPAGLSRLGETDEQASRKKLLTTSP